MPCPASPAALPHRLPCLTGCPPRPPPPPPGLPRPPACPPPRPSLPHRLPCLTGCPASPAALPHRLPCLTGCPASPAALPHRLPGLTGCRVFAPCSCWPAARLRGLSDWNRWGGKGTPYEVGRGVGGRR